MQQSERRRREIGNGSRTTEKKGKTPGSSEASRTTMPHSSLSLRVGQRLPIFPSSLLLLLVYPLFVSRPGAASSHHQSGPGMPARDGNTPTTTRVMRFTSLLLFLYPSSVISPRRRSCQDHAARMFSASSLEQVSFLRQLLFSNNKRFRNM